VWVQIKKDGSINCSAKKFFDDETCKKWIEVANTKPGQG